MPATSLAPEIACYQNYIDGRWESAAAGETYEQRNPARLTEVTGRYALSSAEDAERAIAAAQAAFPAWRDLGVLRRAEFLLRALAAMQRRQDEIARAIVLENGKTFAEAKGEVVSAIKEMEFQIHEGTRLGGQVVPLNAPGAMGYSTRHPLGVTAIIAPWNFPFNVPARKCTPALIAGNTCVLKPALLTPRSAQLFTELFVEAGLPAGVLNFVTGGGREVGETLVRDPRVKAISFTGSTGVGRGIHEQAARTMTRTQLEMGGKNPTVVLADADLELAVEAVATAAFACAGQWCTSTSRAIVEQSILPEFTERLLARMRQIRPGDGLDTAANMGPVCGTAQLENILRYIEIGKGEGAQLIAGGKRVTGAGFDDGCFIEPTVFAGVQPTMTIAQEEIFGPVLALIEARDFEHAIELANDVPFGLSSSIFSRDLQKAMVFLEKTDVGLAHVNMISAYKEPQLEFGGIKESGFGLPEAGRSGLEFFTEHKVVYLKYR